MAYFAPYSFANGAYPGMAGYSAPLPVAPFAAAPPGFGFTPSLPIQAIPISGVPLAPVPPSAMPPPSSHPRGSAFPRPMAPRPPPAVRPTAPLPRSVLPASDLRPGPSLGHGPRAMPALRAGLAETASAPAAAPPPPPPTHIAGYKSASEGRYACAPCDRGFDAASDLAEHSASHISCHAPGCSFSAGRKAVQAHHAREHAGAAPPRLPPSLVELIPPKYRGAASVGNSEAEVAQWRAERRRHFPTAAVVAGKRAVAAEKAFRGDPAAEGRQVKRVRLPPEGEGAAAEGREAAAAAAADAADDDSPPEESGVTLEAAFASANRAAEQGEPISGSLLLRESTSESRRPRVVVCRSHALGRCQHGARCTFSHDPADAAAAEADAAAAPSLPRVPAQPLLSINAKASRPGSGVPACRWFLLGTCRAAARCPFSHGAAAVSASTASATDRPRRRNLLRLLLASELSRESRILLQGIRYLVQRDFFAAPPAGAAATPQAGTDAGAGLVQTMDSDESAPVASGAARAGAADSGVEVEHVSASVTRVPDNAHPTQA